LHTEKLNYLYFLTSIIRVLKLITMTEAGHVARMVKGRAAYRMLMETQKERGNLGRGRRRWVEDIKTDIK
jgi:hypothetical protein